ncbi:hypothetical protein FFONT_0970 [Fervidicoccus fontis Kam940]|uniref:Uncharacterized protein n=1 Tax=Fervidicoccus fontis (strain DSM 19380 / JCM 18336 / VKM B-2539 / Kam940) TaxID=1163730 RepID=I0A1V1_FERFK|nr:hypothetical protein FFONT_0970 [Fervidicoccus fontis Kam940]
MRGGLYPFSIWGGSEILSNALQMKDVFTNRYEEPMNSLRGTLAL